jgi:hypothetical protein
MKFEHVYLDLAIEAKDAHTAYLSGEDATSDNSPMDGDVIRAGGHLWMVGEIDNGTRPLYQKDADGIPHVGLFWDADQAESRETKKKVTFHCGQDTDNSDDEKTVDWDPTTESRDDLMKRALLWSAGNWPESDSEYSGAVWVEDEDGNIEASEEVTISADGELDFPG